MGPCFLQFLYLQLSQTYKMNLAMSGAPLLIQDQPEIPEEESYIRPYTLDIENVSDRPASARGVEDERLRYRYTAGTPYRAAQGGIIAFAEGGNTPDGQELNTNPAMMMRRDQMQVPPLAGILDPSRLNSYYASGSMAQGYANGPVPHTVPNTQPDASSTSDKA